MSLLSSMKQQSQRQTRAAALRAALETLGEKIRQEVFLERIYTKQIEELCSRKDQLTSRLNAYSFEDDEYMRNCSRSLHDLQLLSPSKHGQDSPSKLSRTQSRPIGSSNSLRSAESPSKYSRIDEILAEIRHLQLKIEQKEQTYRHRMAQDEVCNNLLSKIQAQENELLQQIEKWGTLEAKRRAIQEISRKDEQLQEQLFKRAEGVKKAKLDTLNKNRQAVRSGYTSKMLRIIRGE